jgi:hypothetical protein
MHVIEEFSIQRFKQIKRPEEEYSSILYHRGCDTSVVLKGMILKAQLKCGNRYLLLLETDSPFAEGLFIYLLDQSFYVLDRAEISSEIGITYGGETLFNLRIENDMGISFSFFSDEEKWILTVLPKPRRVLTLGLQMLAVRPVSFFGKRHFELCRKD